PTAWHRGVTTSATQIVGWSTLCERLSKPFSKRDLQSNLDEMTRSHWAAADGDLLALAKTAKPAPCSSIERLHSIPIWRPRGISAALLERFLAIRRPQSRICPM